MASKRIFAKPRDIKAFGPRVDALEIGTQRNGHRKFWRERRAEGRNRTDVTRLRACNARPPDQTSSLGSSLHLLLQCCSTSTETVRTIRGGEPRTSTSTFTQLLSSAVGSSSVLLCVHRDRKDYQGRGAQDGHLGCRTAPELPRFLSSSSSSSMLIYVHRDRKDYQGRGAQDVHNKRKGRRTNGVDRLIATSFTSL